MALIEPLRGAIRRPPPLAFDFSVALAALLISVLDLAFWLRVRDPEFPGHAKLLAYVLLAVSAAPLAFKRRNLALAWTVSRLAVVVAVLAHTVYLEDIGVHIVMVVMVFSLAEQCPLPVAMAGLITEYALVIAGSWSEGDFGTFYLFVAAFYFAGLLGLVWFAGRAARRRRQLTRALEVQTAELRKEQERLTGEVVAGERGRISGELQALVIQGIERMARETDAARTELAANPGGAWRSIESIEATGRASLAEMGRMLALMDTIDDPVLVSRADTGQGIQP